MILVVALLLIVVSGHMLIFSINDKGGEALFRYPMIVLSILGIITSVGITLQAYGVI